MATPARHDGVMSTRLPALLAPPIGFGHRGAMADAPANTIESFQLARRLGATGVASDVWVTADGVPVLHADGAVGSRLRRKRLSDLAAADRPEHVPTLAELYDLVGDEYPLSLQIAGPAAFEATLAVARAAGPSAEDNLWLCSADLGLLTTWRPKTTARLINAVRLQELEGGLERHAAELAQRAVDALSLPHREWNGGRVALLHRFGLYAFGRDAEWEREIGAMLDVGVDGVYSDHVDRMMAVIDVYYGEDGQYSEDGGS